MRILSQQSIQENLFITKQDLSATCLEIPIGGVMLAYCLYLNVRHRSQIKRRYFLCIFLCIVKLCTYSIIYI